jgi:isoamyl acetate esterase
MSRFLPTIGAPFPEKFAETSVGVNTKSVPYPISNLKGCDMLIRCIALLIVGAMAIPARADDSIPLKQGEKIVFLGDSITQGGGGAKGYITVIKNALDSKHKDLGIEVVNAGISGNKVPDLQRRLEKDVLAKKPTLVVVYIGINDVWHGEKDPTKGTPKDKFEDGLKEIIGKIQSGGARVVLCTPTVIGEKNGGANPLDAKLDEYADVSRKIAKELKIPLCDLRQAFVNYLKANNSENNDKGILTSDRVHLNEAGNKLVAETMLKTIDK